MFKQIQQLALRGCLLLQCLVMLPFAYAQAEGMGAGKVLEEYYKGIRSGELPIWLRLPSEWRYPNDPSSIDLVDGLQIIDRGEDYFGVRKSAYLQVPESGLYHFAVSGDDFVELYFSGDDNASNKELIAYVYEKTGIEEWDKAPSQTSAAIQLEAGQSYYLELLHLDTRGSNHAAVAWEKPDGTFELLGSENLVAGQYAGDSDLDRLPDVWEMLHFNDLSLASGLPQGATNIDQDGLDDYEEWLLGKDPQDVDTDDRGILDGYGYHGGVFREVWLNQSNSLWDLRKSSTFPNAPDKRYFQNSLSSPRDWGNFYSSRVRGFMTVPETGDYRFKISESDNDSEFWLSTDASKFNKRLLANIRGAVPAAHWQGFPSQESGFVTLEAGQAYYFEAYHVEGAFTDFFEIQRKQANGAYSVVSSASLKSYIPDPNDIDEDELPDDWESSYGLGLDTVDTAGDEDADALINLEEYLLNSDPTLADTDGDGYMDREEASLGTSLTEVEDFALWQDIAPWSLHELGQTQAAKALNIDGSLRLMASGSNRNTFWRTEDHVSLLAQPMSGDFELKAKIRFIRNVYGQLRGHRAGIMIRESLSEGAAEVTWDVTPQREYRAGKREISGAYWESIHLSRVHEAKQLWLKVARSGDTLTLSRSSDDTVWVETERFELSLPEQVEIGLYGVAAKADDYMGVAFESVILSQDSDGDLIRDEVETELGLDPASTDTDGDGYSDYDEMYVYYSDPTVADLGSAVIADQKNASALSAEKGQWDYDGNVFYNQSVRGMAKVWLDVEAAGVHRFEIDVSEAVNIFGMHEWEFVLKMGYHKHFIERKSITLEPTERGTLQILTPWLPEGRYDFYLLLDNVKTGRVLAMHEVRLMRVGGIDADQDGVEDWMQTRMSTLNGIETHAVSQVSPYCIEGRSRYEHALGVYNPDSLADWYRYMDVDGLAGYWQLPEADRNALKRRNTKAAPSERWYSDVHLSEEGPENIAVAFENGGHIETQTVEWVPTNVFETNNLNIRRGDAIRVTAHPEGQAVGSVRLQLSDRWQALEFDADTPQTLRFWHAGVLQLDAEWTHNGQVQTAQMTVTVHESEMADSPVASVYQERDWRNLQLNEGSIIEADWRTHVTTESLAQEPGSTLQITTDAPDTRMIALRAGEEGPILQTKKIRGLRLKSTTNTGVRYLPTEEEDVYLVEMDIVLSELYEDATVKIDIFVADVTFDDGSISKELTRDDFNDVGQTTVRFIKPLHTLTSICHHLRIYHNDVVIGGY